MVDKPLFSINRYDHDGDIWEEGVYIHFGECSIRVCEKLSEFSGVVNTFKNIEKEIKDNYIFEEDT